MPWLWIPILAAALAARIAPEQEGDCDAKTVKSALWCDACSKVLDKDDLIDGKSCKACNESKPKKERTAAEKIQVCSKKYFTCEEHSDQKSSKAGKCEECKKPFKELEDLARVDFKCEECGAEAKAPGACKEAECKKAKKKIVAVCSKSGTFPHVTE